MIIYLFSGPRNVSTALMYSFNQRPDTIAIDEPFYGFRLKKFGKIHPYCDEIMLRMECDDANKIHNEIEEKETIKGNVFVKNMANTFIHMDKNRLLKYRHIFLIRDPIETIKSYIKIDPSITCDDLCLKHQVKIYNWLKEKTKEDPVVIDGNDLRRDPKSILTEICNKLNLSFTDRMLSWPAGPKSVDGIWAQAWYTDLHASTGFAPPSSIKFTQYDLPSNFIPIYNEVLPYYQKLLSYSIRP